MKQRVLFVTDDLIPKGGGGLVACWMLQALETSYDVTTLTWDPPELAALDRMYGTTLERKAFEAIVPSAAERWMVERIPDDSRHQRANYLLRIAKRKGHAFDAAVVSGLEGDVGRRAIQYVHYPYLTLKAQRWTVPGDAPAAKRAYGLLSGHTAPWMLISGFSFERMRRNLTLTNSHWTVGELTRRAGMVGEVLYPPAPGDFTDVPWERRQDAFVCTGRLVAEKRQDWIIDTLALVRRQWPGLDLHVCGSVRDASYVKRLEEMAIAHGPWVRIHRDVSRKELIALLAKCRYGIHAKVEEHFGIAPAEMARAGCIPFVHASGGQVEIVDRDPRLCYSTAEDAAAKILAVLRDAGLQDELRAAVHRRSVLFTPEAFVAGFLDRVASFLAAAA